MTKSWGARLRRWLLLAIVAWIVLTAAAVLLLRWVPPAGSAFMLEARLEALRAGDRSYRTDYRWVSLERISPHAAIAIIASEDQTFPFNYGFDLGSIRSAVRGAQRGRRLRGASTIAQQVARNLFLWPGRSFVRKGIEAYFTVLLETLWPKERILEVYLNVAQFGRGIYGVEAAARHFYHQPAARLSASQAALLAAVLPDPVRWHVDRPSHFVAWKQQWILGQMRNLGGAAYLREVRQSQ
ncbi:MAG TPA: monofunctional biosynthetic peptidoglycan transglycosylase [Steroidobacteraceae bacterium]|jgi:monofunctional biosynthetic peptidoglycan transglycosylase